jgi:outer membrane protein assembly factor BamB
MGFLKKITAYIFAAIIINGCAPSIIKLETFKDVNPYSQYGRSALREFYYEGTVSINLVEKWESQINGGFSNSSITVYDSAVFINDLSGRIYCFSIKNGKTLGQLKYKGSISSAPIIHNTYLIFVVSEINENSSTLYYYDFNLGKEIVSVEIEGRYLNEMLKISDGIVLISESGIALKYDFSGKKIWSNSINNFTHSSPASDGNLIVFGNDNGEITALNSKNGNLVYKKKIGAMFSAGAVISNSKILIGDDDGIFYSLHLTSGELIWKFETSSKIKSEAIVNDEEIFITNLKGDVYNLTSEGKQNWKKKTDGLLNITLLLTDNILILPDSNKKIYFMSRDNGDVLETITLDGRVKLSPVIKNNILFIGYENGILTAYDLAK